MSYTVLARKFRSQTFDEVVGQSAITTTLKNAITQNRVHHGYLFCGTRGVGKTSMARILAKALNCLSFDAPTVTPCGTCDSCINVARGEDMDVVEIDAASNTGVDNIRELRSNAAYRPARSRFKIYIIDEVHMLSAGAFNALLKTLEEPPAHVKFILATTETRKVPATILSRVQRFDFKSISPAEIAEQLAAICKAENVPAEADALKRLARLASGSMRDALSLLDQVMSMTTTGITLEIVNELLPVAHDEIFTALIDRLAASDAAGALQIVDQSLGQGHTLDHWCTLLITELRDLMLLRACGQDTDLVDAPADLRTALFQQSQSFDTGAFVYMISVLEEVRRSAKGGGSGRALIEAAIVRLAEASKFSSLETLLAQVSGNAPPQPQSPARSASSARVSPPNPAPPAATRPPPTTPSATTAPQPKSAPTTPARRRSPGASAPESAPMLRRMTQADLRAAHAEPLVKSSMEIFGGEVVHVQRTGDAANPPPPTENPL